MKRALLLILALFMAFSMAACGGKNSGGKTYKGVDDYEDTTLTVTGSSFVLKGDTTEDGEDMGMDCKMVTSATITGTVVKKDGDTLELEAKTAKVSAKVTGKEAKEFKEMYLSLRDMMEDEDEKKIMEDLINGKTISIKQCDDLWETFGLGEENLTVILDNAEGTFEVEE